MDLHGTSTDCPTATPFTGTSIIWSSDNTTHYKDNQTTQTTDGSFVIFDRTAPYPYLALTNPAVVINDPDRWNGNEKSVLTEIIELRFKDLTGLLAATDILSGYTGYDNFSGDY